MAITTEELNIKVKVDSSGVDKGISEIKSKLASLNEIANKSSLSNLSHLAPEIEGFARACGSLGQVDLSGVTKFVTQMNGLLSKDFGKGIDDLVDSLWRLQTGMKEISNMVNGQNFPQSTQNLTQFVDSLRKLQTAMGSFSKASSGQDFAQAAQSLISFTQSVNQSISGINLNAFNRYATALVKVAAAYKMLKASGATVGASGTPAPAAKKSHQDVGLMVDLTKHMFGLSPKFFLEAYEKFFEIMKLPFEEMAEKFIGWGKAIKNFMGSIGRIALYRAIRTGIKLVTQAVKTGVNNLYQWAAAVGNSFKPTMDSLATSFQYLQNSIGAAVSPLLDMAAPVLEYIINAAVAALNVLNQLFSLLGGKSTYRRAIRQNKEYAAAANSAAGGAGALNDELERTILAFDEINKLNGTNDKAGGGGGGGGAATPDYAGMFEEVEIDNGLADLIRQESWEAIGLAITNRLADAMESINWDLIQEKTAAVAMKIATLLNGAFANKRFWIDIGTTIAEGLNTYTLLDTTFFHNTDFEDFGDSLAEAVRQAIITVDWTQLGEACVSIPTAIVESIHGFVENWSIDDWSFLGLRLAEMVNGALMELPFDIAIPDFVELATGILHSMNTAIKNIKWADILDEIATGFKNADWAGLISELGQFLWNTKWVIAIALTLEIGKVGFSLAAMALKAKILNAILNGSGGLFSSGGGTAAGTAGGAGGLGLVLSKAIPIVVGLAATIGGIVSYKNSLETEGILDDILSTAISGVGGFMAGKAIWGTNAAGIAVATIPLIIELVITIKKTINDQIQGLRDNFEKYSKEWSDEAILSNDQIEAVGKGLSSNAGWGAVANEARVIAQTLNAMDGASDITKASLENDLNPQGVLGFAEQYETSQKTAIQKATEDAKALRAAILESLTLDPDMSKEVKNAGSSTLNVFKAFSSSMTAKSIATRNAMLTDFDMETPVSSRISNAMGKAVSGISTGATNSKTAASTLRTNVLNQMSMATDMLNLSNSAMSHFKKGLTDALVQVTTSANSLRNAILGSLTFSSIGDEIGVQIANGIRSQTSAVASAAGTVKKALTEGLSNIDVAGQGNNAVAQFVAGVRNAAPAAQDAGYHVRNYLINGLATSSSYAYQWGADAGAQFAAGLRSQINAVASAAASVAQAMRNYLHFSEPDVGPLSDASTYMPDFMTLMAEGIRDNAWRVKNEVNSVASMMRPEFNTNANYSVDAVVGGGMATALTEALGGVTMQTNGSVPINVYIGGEKLDSLNARSQARTNFRSGGR